MLQEIDLLQELWKTRKRLTFGITQES